MKGVNLAIYSVLIAALGFFILDGRYSERTYSFFMDPSYHTLIFLMLALVIFFIVFEKKIIIKEKIPWKILYAIAFIPLIFYPFFRCYFHIPHIFCQVCPRRCVWGYVRPITVPGVLLINLYSLRWCNSYCPVGSLQDEQIKLSKKRIDLPKSFSYIKYLILALVIITYFWILDARRNFVAGNFYDLMFMDAFTIAIWSFMVALGIFTISFLVHRFWCNYLCPIGTGSELLVRLENRMLRRI